MQQTADVTGDGNTVVQIAGDHNTVVLGRVFLTLTRFDNQRRTSHLLNALSPYSRSTRLRGRDDELASLRAFLSSPKPISVRVVVGGGGSGKTRLALELCDQMQAEGWNAGFATSTEADRFLQGQNLSAWGWQKPTLVVMDYAAAKAQALGQWLDELADRSAATPYPLRILLLERSADPGSGWWTGVFGGGWRALDKLALLDPAVPVPIRPLATQEHRVALLQDMLGIASPDTPVALPLHDPVFNQQLMQLSWGGDPLFLMLAAMAMVSQGHRALTLSRTDLADVVAQGEIDRIAKLARAHGLTPDLVLHLAACATLAQGLPRPTFIPFAAAEQQATGWTQPDAPAALFKLLQQALPHTQGIAPVIPDMVGEALLVRLLQGDEGREAVLRCYAAFGHRVAETVIRCVQDFAGVGHWLDAIVEQAGHDGPALEALAASLPQDSLALGAVNLRVAQRVQALDARAGENNPAHSAQVLARLAVAQGHMGLYETAVQTAQQVVDYLRARATPDARMHCLDLGEALHNLALLQIDLGQHSSALASASEAVSICRTLLVEQPHALQPGLAASLNTLCIAHSALGQAEPALQAALESVDLHQALAAEEPATFAPDLAMALSNLASAYGDSFQLKPSLDTATEVVDMYRMLAAQQPDVYPQYLAAALNNLANRQRDQGKAESSMQSAQQAVDIYRRLAAQRPGVFTLRLATALAVLATCRRHGLGAAAALAVAHEALRTLHPVYLQRPLAHAQLMQTIQRDYADLCRDCGQTPDAELLQPAPLEPPLPQD
ncbi:Tetratricopeptide repeat-containing protein [Rhodoferax sp. OV413]|uniref:tetratricopeptide repeat protein n=1 Tax=Rhodoferax sp. OV413 TaxID=1855285 RepID=UPI000882487D|nr:tetratricopeptide repeat protein [Rhodoferax sp. OV413]SDP83330.1 Tetratricopeptide repeat-containing protein [Rhodoferax sp. OV413]